MIELLDNVASAIKDIAQDFVSEKEPSSKNWGMWHSFAIKFVKSSTRKTNTLPITTIQLITESTKYVPWPGLEITRAAVPNKFREKAYQYIKKYFEDKYGEYPVPANHHWNYSATLNIQQLAVKNRKVSDQTPVLYHIRGGTWMFRHSCFDYHMFKDLTEASSARIVSIEHRLGPQYTMIPLIEDVIAGYLYLIAPKSEGGTGISNQLITVGGYSSGGHLAASLLHNLRNLNIPQPAGAYLISPILDLTLSQPSFFENSKKDMLWDEKSPVSLDRNGLHIHSKLHNLVYDHSPPHIAERMKKDGSPFGPMKTLLWPELSPLFDPNMDNLAPTISIVGDRDSLRDDSILYGELRAKAEIKSKNKTTIIPNIQTYNYEDMVHIFPVLPPNKYCTKAIKAMSEFIYQALNAKDQNALDERKYKYLADYKTAYMNSTYNMYWNNIKNNYLPWNSTYPILPFPTYKKLIDPVNLNSPQNQSLIY